MNDIIEFSSPRRFSKKEIYLNSLSLSLLIMKKGRSNKSSGNKNKLFDKKLAFFVAVIAITAIAIVSVNMNNVNKESVSLSPGDVGFYSFEGVLTDSSGNGNTLTSVLPTSASSAVYDNSGKVGKAIKLTQSAYLKRSPMTGFNSQLGSMSMYVKLPIATSQLGSLGKTVFLYADSSKSWTSYAYRFYVTIGADGKLHFKNDGASCTALLLDSSSTLNWNANEWHHVAITWSTDKTKQKIYVDGKDVTFVKDSQLCGTGVTNTHAIGSYFGLAASNRYNGDVYLDELRLYNKVIAGAELCPIGMNWDVTQGRCVLSAGNQIKCITDADCSVEDQCINTICVERKRSLTSFSDIVFLSKSSDRWNLGERNPFIGTIDNDDLSEYLTDGQLESGEDYEQTILVNYVPNTFKYGRFYPGLFRDSDYEEAVGFNDNTPTLGFQISSSTWILNYTLEFINDVQNIKGKTIPLLGRKYDVIDYSSVNKKLILIDSLYKNSLYEGETTTVSGHEISIGYLDSNEVKFIVDGQNIPSTGSLMEGQTHKLSDGTYIGVIDIRKQDIVNSPGFVSFSLGQGRLEITSGSDIKMNSDTITGIKGFIHLSYSTTTIAKPIDKIVIEWKTDDETFLTTEKELVIPRFNNLKFNMPDFKTSVKEITDINYDSDTSMKLQVPLKDGIATFNFVYLDSNGLIGGLGKGVDQRLAIGSNTLTFYEKKGPVPSAQPYHSYFVASYRSPQHYQNPSESYLLRAKVTFDSGDNRNEVTIDKNVAGAWVEACGGKILNDDCDIGVVTFTITSIQYTSGGDESVSLTAGPNVYFDRVYTKEGMEIVFPYEKSVVGKSSIDLILRSEDKDENLGIGGTYNLNIGANLEKDISVLKIIGGSTEGWEIGNSDSFRYIQYTPLATEVIHYTSANQDTARIIYHGDESSAEVYLSGRAG